MNRSRYRTQSVTSAPRARHDDDRARVRKYAIMMGIRMLCFVLMVVIQPLGWHTLVLAVGAVVLPYIAVVVANVGQYAGATAPERPELALTSPAPPQTNTERPVPTIIEVRERRNDEEEPAHGD